MGIMRMQAEINSLLMKIEALEERLLRLENKKQPGRPRKKPKMGDISTHLVEPIN